MATRRVNPRAVKLHRSYSVPELAACCGVHKNTVRHWQRDGLKPLDGGRPVLFQGAIVRAFLAIRIASRKRPCPPGTLYCFRCREPRPPALGMVDFVSINEAAHRKLSYFEPGFEELRSYSSFLRGFHDEIKKPVMPGNEAMDYLPTQVVAEYLWTRVDPPFDGVVFGSSQITGVHHNLVLFPHASGVEGAADEPQRKISFTYESGPDEDDEDREREERVLFEPLPPAPAEGDDKTRKPSRELLDEWFNPFERERPPAPASALRLAPDGVTRTRVTSINYKFDTVAVAFDDWVEDDRF